MKYKVGDKVKIVSLQSVGRGCCQDVVGDVGEIILYDSSDILKYKVAVEDGGRWWWEESNLELIEDIKPNTIKVIETNKGETELNEVKVETASPKFKKGDKVICISNPNFQLIKEGEVYTVKQSYESGGSYYVKLEEFNRAHSYSEDKFELYIEPRNYRNMKPTDLIKVSIDGFEDEIPLGDLIHTLALVGNSTGMFGYRFFKMLTNLDKDGICEDAYNIEASYKQAQLMKDFFVIEAQKEADKANLKELISNKQNELKELQDKLNQLN